MEQNNHNAPLDVDDGVINYLKAKCDRYERALKEIRTGKILPHLIAQMALEGYEGDKNANEALSGEGKKQEPVKEIEYMPVHPEDARKANCPQYFPMHLLDERQAQSNHGQTLKRLKERGGLSVKEILSIVQGKRWAYYNDSKWEEALKMLNEILNQKEDKQC